MNRVDFHSVSAILFHYLKEADTSQTDYMYMDFANAANDIRVLLLSDSSISDFEKERFV